MGFYPVPDPRIGEEIQPMQGVRVWRNRLNQFLVAEIHYTADPARRGDWKYRESPSVGGLRSWRWLKEQEIDWKAQAGRLVFETFDEEVHTIAPFPIPHHWPRWVLWDPGWSNPNSVLWVAIDTDSAPAPNGFLAIHVYREFYAPKRTSENIALMIFETCGGDSIQNLQPTEPIEGIVVDPGARQEHQSAARSEGQVAPEAETTLQRFTDEMDRLGWDVPVETGVNSKTEALLELIQRVGNWWCDFAGKPLFDRRNAYRQPTEAELVDGAYKVAPTVLIHRTCTNTIHEMRQYRWADWSAQEVRDRRNDPEKPVDKNDHSMTNLIRFVNLVSEQRAELGGQMVELARFRSRFTQRVVRSADEIAAEHHAKAAARFGRRARGQREG